MRPVHVHIHRGAVALEGRPSFEGKPIPSRRMAPLSKQSGEAVNRFAGPRGTTADAGQFDEAKHKRDGGKFSSTEGAGKSASNAEHSAKAAEVAKAARTEKNPEHRKLHNEALQAWADARQKLDPNKPMSEQSAEYKAALKTAEEATAKASEAKHPKPAPEGKPEQSKGKPGSPTRAAKPSPKGVTASQALGALRRARREVDPDEHDNQR